MMDLYSFSFYKKSGVSAFYHRVPISYLEQFREVMRSYGIAYKIRYRGPRRNRPSSYRRSFGSMQSTCLREDATHFSAYGY